MTRKDSAGTHRRTPTPGVMPTIMLVLTLVALGLVGLVLKKTGESASGIVKTMAGS
ncbi:hypothetical protein ACTXM7_11420 [Corynebacterium variabile]|uniref:hypothetical protein n=1 Tax=Corynebacterium variabile TaxID=1727 RepID=UPI003FD52BC0